MQRQAGGLLRVSRDAEEVSSRTGLRPLPSSPATQGILVFRPWRERPLGTAPKKAYLLHDLMHDFLCSKPYSAQAMPLIQGEKQKTHLGDPNWPNFHRLAALHDVDRGIADGPCPQVLQQVPRLRLAKLHICSAAQPMLSRSLLWWHLCIHPQVLQQVMLLQPSVPHDCSTPHSPF